MRVVSVSVSPGCASLVCYRRRTAVAYVVVDCSTPRRDAVSTLFLLSHIQYKANNESIRILLAWGASENAALAKSSEHRSTYTVSWPSSLRAFVCSPKYSHWDFYSSFLTAKFGRLSRVRLLVGAHLCARGPVPQWPRRATHLRHTSFHATREATRRFCAATTGDQYRGRNGSDKKPKPKNPFKVIFFRTP